MYTNKKASVVVDQTNVRCHRMLEIERAEYSPDPALKTTRTYRLRTANCQALAVSHSRRATPATKQRQTMIGDQLFHATEETSRVQNASSLDGGRNKTRRNAHTLKTMLQLCNYRICCTCREASRFSPISTTNRRWQNRRATCSSSPQTDQERAAERRTLDHVVRPAQNVLA